MPLDAWQTRDFTVGTAAEAGNLVQTTVDGSQFIDILRRSSVTVGLGARQLFGLTSNLALPKKTVTTTLTNVAEIAALTETQPNSAQVLLSPKRMGTFVEISKQAARETGMRLGLKYRQRFYVEDMLAAALINSVNDACHALADFVGGDQQRFVKLMNQRAKHLGMRNTHFTNACGHDAADHYSSAHDLSILTNEVIKSKVVTELAVRESMQISDIGATKNYTLQNKNALIGRYQGALGLKTGYTSKAGTCLIALAERGGTRVMLVMLNSANRWWDAVDLFDLAFAQTRHDS